MSRGPAGLPAAAAALLRGWQAPDAQQEQLCRAYLDHLTAHPDALWRDGPPAHLTASCFVVDEPVRRVLLVLHRKGRFWVQPGGHCEPGDASLAAAALREAREESGIRALVLHPEPVDLHRHRLPAAFGRCREHLDVAFVATCPPASPPAGSAESIDVAWWPLDDLPGGVVADLPGRLAAVAARLRGRAR